jgi:pimeloyl-ACP methyl ester carboxylesterase
VTGVTGVTGGPGGIAARYDDMYATAGWLEEGTAELAEAAAQLTVLLADVSHPEAAALDPVGAIRSELALVEALARLATAAVRCAELSAALRAAAVAYQCADDLGRDLIPDVIAIDKLPILAAQAPITLLRTRSAPASAQQLLSRDPQLTDVVEQGLSRSLFSTAPPVAGRRLGGLFDDGRPVVTRLGNDQRAQASPPPRSLADLMTQLSHRNDGQDGEISVSIVTPVRAGPRQVIVDIPGTKDWSLQRSNPDVTNLASNLRAIDGQPSSYEQGVLDALRASGVTPHDQVLLVGHSLGGLVAVNAAATAARTGEFDITHVVTAGAPIGALTIPRRVAVLAVENDGDVVPHLDGRGNPDRPNVTTVTIQHNQGRIDANHDLDTSYVAGAADIDASHNPSTQAYLSGLQPFLSGPAMTTTAYRISRAP